MHQSILRERVFDTACFLVGRLGRTLSYKLNTPLFIIGTGRCGTSLLVDMLKSHPSLSGFPGEGNELWHPKLEPFESTSLDTPPIEIDPKHFTEISIANWPPYHGQKISDIFTGFHLITGRSKVFFTKSAMLSFMIPKILDIFPDARFIHIYRFGPSVVASYFKKNFGKYSRHVYTEKDYHVYCARYWSACILEIEKRKQELSLETKSQFIEFSYEELCQKPRDILNKIANFLGVDPNKFGFDITTVVSQNYKTTYQSKNQKIFDLLDVMLPGMKLKGYLPDLIKNETLKTAPIKELTY